MKVMHAILRTPNEKRESAYGSRGDTVGILSFVEWNHARLVGIHNRVVGDQDISSLLSSDMASGRGPAKEQEHIFIWHSDDNNDGRIDQLVIRDESSFEASELEALEPLQSMLGQSREFKVELELKKMNNRSSRRQSTFSSFVTRRHHRKGREAFEEWLAGQFRRECDLDKLPESKGIESVDHCPTKERGFL